MLEGRHDDKNTLCTFTFYLTFTLISKLEIVLLFKIGAAMDPNADLSQLNYTVLIPYNGTIATGGNSLVDNLNMYYEVRLPVSSLDHYTMVDPSAHVCPV